MAIHAVGTAISFSDMTEEFGSPTENRFGRYRLSQEIKDDCPTPVTLDTFPLDDGIPSSGPIKFSDFYSKKLNVVLDIYNGNTEYTINARDRFNNQPNKRTVIGGFKTLDLDATGVPIADGKKIRIIVDKKVGSGTGSVQKCALRTGAWASSTDVKVDIFGRGKLGGAGGNGGNGANGISDNGTNGGDGASGLGIEKNGTVVTVHSGGIISQGFAGGGGGGGGRETSKNDRRSGGGGGGGGAGLPAGAAGAAGSPQNGTRDHNPHDKTDTEGNGNPTFITQTANGDGYGPSFLSSSGGGGGRSTTLMGGTVSSISRFSRGTGYSIATYDTTLENGNSLPLSGSGLRVNVQSLLSNGRVNGVTFSITGSTTAYSVGSILTLIGGNNNAQVQVTGVRGGGGNGLRVHYSLVDPCAGNSGAVKDIEIVDTNYGNGAYRAGVIARIDKNPGEGGANATFRIDDWSGRGVTDTGHDGEAATENFGGAGGRGGDNHDQAFGGRGGVGGDYLGGATNGQERSTEGHTKPPGNAGVAGSNGAAIRKTNNSINFSLVTLAGATVIGSTSDTGVFQD